ncbi:MAG: hypothetical protein CMJ81_04125 [Planctomycetaceae bacterium]|nr:hypothetical protein [Planctomycetaceae bacterium]MBP62752.1 hypothetical protein [Planctomycetaceae bacterium]
MAAKHQMKNRKLSVQALEARNMFAGNVFANLVGTTLAVGGDAQDNQMEIEEIAPNTIEVRGLMGTTINGAATQIFAANLIENVSVRTAAGNDQVFIKNLSLTDTPNGNLKVVTDIGDDAVHMKNVSTTQSIGIDTGDHNDLVRVFRVGTDGTWSTNSGNGHDRVAMHIVKASDMTVDMMDGHDKLRISVAKTVNDLTVDTGTENDFVKIEQVRIGNDLHVRTDSGTDRVFIQQSVAGNDVGVDTGDDADEVHFRMVHARRDVFAKTGTGDDLLVMHRVKAHGQILVGMDSGDDQAYIMQSKANDVYVDTADGNDNVYMDQVFADTATGNLHVYLGAGADVFQISNSDAANPFFDGGADDDILYDALNGFGMASVFSINFEAIL